MVGSGQSSPPTDPWKRERQGTLSGRYEGKMTAPSPGRAALDLRVNVDERLANSPVMGRVSGDLSQYNSISTPGEEPHEWWVYIESWVVERPVVSYQRDAVLVRGAVRFYREGHPATTLRLCIPWPPGGPPVTAAVTFHEEGAAAQEFSCEKAAEDFRDLGLSVAVCKSVGNQAILPRFDTHSVADRPPDLPRRELTIESAYREAGVRVTIDPVQVVINDKVPGFETWTDDQLHDAMLANWWEADQDWPRWSLWGFMASKYFNEAVGGVMFDAAVLRGADHASEPDRRGFAVFRNHDWFEDLGNVADVSPDVRARAFEAERRLLYTWVHEAGHAGHAFNLSHSWEKGRPDALSWMNYDWKYEENKKLGAFWSRFRFRFDDDELIHLRHGDRPSVIMGGDPWTNSRFAAGRSVSFARIEGSPPLEIILRAKPLFDFMEPVVIAARVRNLWRSSLKVDARFNFEFGGVTYYIQRPDGRVIQYDPLLCKLGRAEKQDLKPEAEAPGEDRISQEVFLSYGRQGFYFDSPGEYLVRAVYRGLGDVLIPSNVLRLRVAYPAGRKEENDAQDFFSREVGLFLYLYGSGSPRMKSVRERLLEMAQEKEDTMTAVRLRLALANSVLHPFYRLTERSAGRGAHQLSEARQEGSREITLVRAEKADPEEALRLTDPALDYLRRHPSEVLNLVYTELANRRLKGYLAADRAAEAKPELRAVRDDLAQRNAGPRVLAAIDRREASLDTHRHRRSPKTT
jgi:hypothetical protein